MELLVSITVLGIISGVDVSILSAGLDSWGHIQRRLTLQQVSAEIMETVLEGGFDEEGLRDGVELKEATAEAIGVVPLWTDRSHRPDPQRNKEQRFTLEKQFKSGSPIPVGQVRLSDADDWEVVPIAFERGEGLDPKKPDDTVTFLKPIPSGSRIRILYTPDSAVHPETVIRFRFDPDKNQIFRSYAGRTTLLPQRSQQVKVEKLAFLYYDNLNRPLPTDRTFSPAELRRITGVKVQLLLSRSQERKEVTSFTNIRNVQTVGVTISKGTVVPLPSPSTIRAFSLGDLAGLKKDGVVELSVRAGGRFQWRIRLEFKPAENPLQVLLHRFQIQAPVGQVKTSGIINRLLSRTEFVDLMGIDRTGFFDYDDDPDIADSVMVPDGGNLVEVTECDFDVAALFIRP